jgi:hypothetical protein
MSYQLSTSFHTANGNGMSDTQDEKSLFEKGKELFNSIKAERLKNNFYGYLIVSFCICNFENIILILKSKNAIEMTLIYIQAQPNFAKNFFWNPLAYGVGAALIMPGVTALYVIFTGVFYAIRNESKGVGSTIWARYKQKNENKLVESKGNLEKLKEEINNKRLIFNNINESIKLHLQQKQDLERYLGELASVYGAYRNNYSYRNMMGLLDAVDKADLSKHFPDNELLDELIQFSKDHTYEPAEADAVQAPNHAQKE